MRMRLLTALFFLFVSGTLTAQIETTMPGMRRLHQASYYNPAILPEYTTSFSLPVFPGISTGVFIGGLKGKAVLKNVDQDGLIDLSAVHRDIKGDHFGVNLATNVELFHYRFKGKNWYYGINLNNRMLTGLALSKDFLGLVINGNDYFTGKTVDFSKTRIQIIAFNELGFSMSRNYNRWNVGGRVKLLHGVGAASTSASAISLYTPQQTTNEVGLKLTGTLNTSGIPVFVDSIGNEKVSDKEKEIRDRDLYNMRNLGAGIDLGVTYDVNNFLTVGGSVTDLGFIRWTNKTYNYKQTDVNINYGGLPYRDLDGDSTAQAYLDSLQDLFNGSVSRNSFNTALPARFMLNGTYRLSKRNEVGAMVQGCYYAGQFMAAYTVNYTRKWRVVDLTANYSVIGGNFANVGLGVAAKLGAFQCYLVQDNVLAYFLPQQIQYIHIRLGLNFVWGEIRRPLKVY